MKRDVCVFKQYLEPFRTLASFFGEGDVELQTVVYLSIISLEVIVINPMLFDTFPRTDNLQHLPLNSDNLHYLSINNGKYCHKSIMGNNSFIFLFCAVTNLFIQM